MTRDSGGSRVRFAREKAVRNAHVTGGISWVNGYSNVYDLPMMAYVFGLLHPHAGYHCGCFTVGKNILILEISLAFCQDRTGYFL